MGTTAAIEVLALLLTKSLEFSQVMLKAQAEGRDITSEEIDTFRESLMQSDDALEDAIKKAKAEGR